MKKKTNIPVAFGEKVKKLRLDKKMTQMDLAYKSRLHSCYIHSVEKGERNVSLRNIVKIAKAIECSAGELLHGFEGIEDNDLEDEQCEREPCDYA